MANNGEIPLTINRFSAVSGDGTGLMFKVNDDINSSYYKSGIFFERTGTGGIGKLHFATSFLTSSDNVNMSDARMTITASGKIGIGTTEPLSLLNLREDSDAIPFVIHRYSTVVGDETGILFKVYGSTTNNYHKGGIFFERTASSGRGSIHFATSSSTSNNNVGVTDAKMTIISSGNVGIGTISPTHTLDIDGQIRIRGGSPVEGGALICDSDGNASWQKTKYEVGDFAQGGIVFWVDETGEHGLVCAIEDWGTTYWLDDCYCTNSRASGIYAGEMNTLIIISAVNAHNPGSWESNAAINCNEYYSNITGIKYTDWYLPSLDELRLIYDNQESINTISFENSGDELTGLYWSSTELDCFRAYAKGFSDGDEYPNLKTDNLRKVRPIRNF